MKTTAKMIAVFLWGLGFLSILLIFLAQSNQEATEKYFSLGFYRYWSFFLSSLTSLLPFSLAECSIIILVVGVIIFLVLFIRSCLHRGRKCLSFIGYCLVWIGAVLSAALFLFTISGGLNYYRFPFLYYSDLELYPSPTSQLEALCTELVDKVNTLRQGRAEDGEGVFILSSPFDKLAKAGAGGYAALMEQNPKWRGLFDVSATTRTKAVFFSEGMSYLQIVGIFTPYTMEANINVHTSPIDIPFSICHELAHVSGIMREDEANYLGYLACMASGDPDLEYSGVITAFINTANALYTHDSEAHTRVMALLEPSVQRDLAADNAYYDAYISPVGNFSRSINNAYLRANNQLDGVASYGRMVDLLLAEYRLRHGL